MIEYETEEDRKAEEQVRLFLQSKKFFVMSNKSKYPLDWIVRDPMTNATAFAEFKRRNDDFEFMMKLGGPCVSVEKYVTATNYAKATNLPLMFFWLLTDALLVYITNKFPPQEILLMPDRRERGRISPCVRISLDDCRVYSR